MGHFTFSKVCSFPQALFPHFNFGAANFHWRNHISMALICIAGCNPDWNSFAKHCGKMSKFSIKATNCSWMHSKLLLYIHTEKKIKFIIHDPIKAIYKIFVLKCSIIIETRLRISLEWQRRQSGRGVSHTKCNKSYHFKMENRTELVMKFGYYNERDGPNNSRSSWFDTFTLSLAPSTENALDAMHRQKHAIMQKLRWIV